MADSSIYRARARAHLGGIFENAWLMLVVANLVMSFISGLVSSTGIGTLIIAGPLAYGLSHLYMKRIRSGLPVELGDVFKGFQQDFVRNFLLGLLQSLFIVLWTLLFIIPGYVKAYAYSMAFYVANDHPELSASECLKKSERLMQGHKWELFLLDFSFIGWMLLSIFTCGIGALWVGVYMDTAHACFYEDLVAREQSYVE